MTYPRFLEDLVGDDAGALEHVLARARGEAHLLPSGAGVVFGAVAAGELAFRATSVRRNIAEVAGGERCHERALISTKTVCVTTLYSTQKQLHFPLFFYINEMEKLRLEGFNF